MRYYFFLESIQNKEGAGGWVSCSVCREWRMVGAAGVTLCVLWEVYTHTHRQFLKTRQCVVTHKSLSPVLYVYSPGHHARASRYKSPQLLPVTVQAFTWHGSCGWGHDTCMNTLLWSGEVCSEFSWCRSCDAFRGSDAFVPGRAASPALSWLGISMALREAA